MTGKERAAWRAKANALEPIIQIGKEGITDNLLNQIDDTLDVRELIKVRVHLETAPKKPKEFAQIIGEKLGAEIIQVIGGVIVFYREADPERIQEKKKKRGSGNAKSKAKKKVKIKGLRQRQKEKETKNPYAVYDRMNKDKNKKPSRTK